MYDKTDLAHLKVLEKMTQALVKEPGVGHLFREQLRRIKAEIYRVSRRGKK